MGNKILIVSGIAFWLLAAVFIAGKTGLLRKIQQQSRKISAEITCAKNEVAIYNYQIDGYKCLKIPTDGGKFCTKSSECESGYCIAKGVRAKNGTCHDSVYHPGCELTIEESQEFKEGSVPLPCAY